MGWTNTIPFPFIVVDPTTGSPIFIIDSTGAHVISSTTGIDLGQGPGGPPPAVIGFKDLSGGAADEAFIQSQAIAGAMALLLDSGTGTTGSSNGGSSHALLGPSQLVLDYQDVTAPNSGNTRISQQYNGIFMSGSSGGVNNYLSRDAEPWNALSYQNGWADLGANWETGAYRLFADGWVRFRGVIIGGTHADGTVVATLPAAYRPAKDKIIDIALISAGAAGPNVNFRVFSATGQIQCFGIAATANGNCSLEGASFSLIT